MPDLFKPREACRLGSKDVPDMLGCLLWDCSIPQDTPSMQHSHQGAPRQVSCTEAGQLLLGSHVTPAMQRSSHFGTAHRPASLRMQPFNVSSFIEFGCRQSNTLLVRLPDCRAHSPCFSVLARGLKVLNLPGWFWNIAGTSFWTLRSREEYAHNSRSVAEIVWKPVSSYLHKDRTNQSGCHQS